MEFEVKIQQTDEKDSEHDKESENLVAKEDKNDEEIMEKLSPLEVNKLLYYENEFYEYHRRYGLQK